MDTGMKLAVAAVFVWLGMVVAISFVETPLRFRAPGVSLKIGLGIGRLVFRALNLFEYAFAAVIGFALFTHELGVAFDVMLFIAVGALLAQTLLVRPLLGRRTESVLAGHEGRRSGAHWAYVGLEVLKVLALVWSGVLLVGTLR